MYSLSRMKVAFISNKLTLRGTEIALYNYADYNEKYLNNESIIITRSTIIFLRKIPFLFILMLTLSLIIVSRFFTMKRNLILKEL